MKLFDYLSKINAFRNGYEGKQNAVNLINDKINFNRELYYDIKIDLPNIKVDTVINKTEYSRINVKETLSKLQELLLKLGIYLILTNNEESLTVKQKFKTKKTAKINLMTASDYQVLFSFDSKQEQLDDSEKKISYIAFFDDTKLTNKQLKDFGKYLEKNVINQIYLNLIPLEKRNEIEKESKKKHNKTFISLQTDQKNDLLVNKLDQIEKNKFMNQFSKDKQDIKTDYDLDIDKIMKGY